MFLYIWRRGSHSRVRPRTALEASKISSSVPRSRCLRSAQGVCLGSDRNARAAGHTAAHALDGGRRAPAAAPGSDACGRGSGVEVGIGIANAVGRRMGACPLSGTAGAPAGEELAGRRSAGFDAMAEPGTHLRVLSAVTRTSLALLPRRKRRAGRHQPLNVCQAAKASKPRAVVVHVGRGEGLR